MKKLAIGTLIFDVAFGLIVLIGSFLFAFNKVYFGNNAFTFVFIISILLFVALLVFLCYVILQIKEKARQEELKKTIEQDRQIQLLSLYRRFGIEPQRDEKGRLKSFYELLGIEPQFDEFGERIPTVYELLGILPKIDEFGREIPNVIFIKNKAKLVCEKVPLFLLNLTTKQNADALEKDKLNNLPADLNAKAAEGSSASKKDDKKKKVEAQKFAGMKTPSAKSGKKVDEPSLGGWLDLLNDMFGSKDDFKPPKPLPQKNSEPKPEDRHKPGGNEKRELTPPSVDEHKKPKEKPVPQPKNEKSDEDNKDNFEDDADLFVIVPKSNSNESNAELSILDAKKEKNETLVIEDDVSNTTNITSKEDVMHILEENEKNM